jgi:hypothetical protein
LNQGPYEPEEGDDIREGGDSALNGNCKEGSAFFGGELLGQFSGTADEDDGKAGMTKSAKAASQNNARLRVCDTHYGHWLAVCTGPEKPRRQARFK